MISWRAFTTRLPVAPALLLLLSVAVEAGEFDIPTVDATSSIPLNGLPVVEMAADFARPYLYVVEEDGVAARLIVINTDTEVTERVLSVGDNVFDLDVHYPEARLYSRTISAPTSNGSTSERCRWPRHSRSTIMSGGWRREGRVGSTSG